MAVAGALGIAAAGSAALYLFAPSTSALYPLPPFTPSPASGAPAAVAPCTSSCTATFGLNPMMVLMLPFLGYAAASCAALGLGDDPCPAF